MNEELNHNAGYKTIYLRLAHNNAEGYYIRENISWEKIIHMI